MKDEADILLRELPVKFIYKDTRILGILALFFGGSFFLIPLAYFFKTVIAGEPVKETLLLLAVAVVFLPLFIVGLSLIKRKKEIVISREWVSRTYFTLFKKEEWKEPIETYQGILLRTDVQATGGNGSDLIYALDLLHTNVAKTIRLFKGMEYSTTVSKWKEYCQLFNKSPLERVGKDSIIRREVQDIGKALLDLVKEGKVTIYQEPPVKPGSVQISDSTRGVVIILPNKTEMILGKSAFIIKQDSNWKNETRYEYPAVRSVLIDYSKQSNQWAWAVVILERNSSHRSVFAHNLDYEVLVWLQYFLMTEIINRSGK